jgi:hypothetical protein
MNLKKLTPFVAKTFDDLVFTDHANVNGGVQAKLDLGNGLEISVVSMKKEGYGLYGDASAGTYEVAVFQDNSMLPLSPFDDVLGWRTEAEVTELMGNLQGKPEDIHSFIEQMHEHKKDTREELELD